MRAADVISRQCSALLESKNKAIFYAVLLSVLPFASWFSVALVALVTLRKGPREGFDVMLPALIIHSVPLMMIIPWASALVNTVVAYLPCYLGALALRYSQKWSTVAGVFFIQALLGSVLIQYFFPGLVVAQFAQLKVMLMPYQEMIDISVERLGVDNVAQLFFGIQLFTVTMFTIISLMFARNVQAKLFLPGGFKTELLSFRADKLSFLVLLLASVGAYYEIPVAINTLPLVLVYFFLAGFGLIYSVFSHKSPIKVFILLLLFIVLKPTFVVFAYIVFGAVDSLFNFRTYLSTEISKSV